ncbi:MAG: tyrosine-type recombinase/integrase, partial [Burkholderiales bacterium]
GILSFAQAQAEAIKRAKAITKQEAEDSPYKVNLALDDYLAWYAINRKALASTTNAANAHIRPTLGEKLVADLTARQIRKWHEFLAQAPARLRSVADEKPKFREYSTKDAELVRRRKATANRVLTVLKAALNHAWHDHRVSSNEAWASVKPFRDVDSPKIRYLSIAESTRLLNACKPDFRKLVTAALLTGCRYGELIKMSCADYNTDAGAVLVRATKNGKPRHVPLTDEGRQFFKRICAGRSDSEFAFLRSDGAPWGKSHQARPLRDACKVAKIKSAIDFHGLRHTYASALAMQGVPLQVIAEALGHGDTRITSRHYAHLMPSFVADTIRKYLPSFGLKQDNVKVIGR